MATLINVIRFGDIFRLHNKDLLEAFTRPDLLNNRSREVALRKSSGAIAFGLSMWISSRAIRRRA
jgi:hypothetical protein